ncbi:hypothetical protein AB1484_28665 [Parafrankia sp. FMc6]|uniref:hypothetical protein n=1 Tax=Parafrankia soli TaxID=2599596 RepID=UPI0034D57F12
MFLSSTRISIRSTPGHAGTDSTSISGTVDRPYLGGGDENQIGRPRVQHVMAPPHLARFFLLAAALTGWPTLAACGDNPQSAPPVAGRQSFTAIDALNCGSERIDPRNLAAGDARRCFVEAVAAGRAATLTSTATTTEGDPIVYSLSSDTNGTITIIEDTSQDRFRGVGAPDRTRYVCTSIDDNRETRPHMGDVIVTHLHGCTSPGPL